MKIYNWNALSSNEQQRMLTRPSFQFKNFSSDSTAKTPVLKQVLEVSQEEITAAKTQLSQKEQQAILWLYKQFEMAHLNQFPKTHYVEMSGGYRIERKPQPVERVGFYISGNSEIQLSTLLMFAVPAQLANCPTKVVCAAANAEGKIDPKVLYASACCGINHIYKISESYALTAMAYGTDTVTQVNKIFVSNDTPDISAFKRQLAKDNNSVTIKASAPCSELLIITDDTTEPTHIAADIISQAEYNSHSHILLITSNIPIAEQILKALSQQLQSSSNKVSLEATLSRGGIIITETLEQAIALSNDYGPQCLLLSIKNYENYKTQTINAETVFLGAFHPLFPYVMLNKVTMDDFIKWTDFQTVTNQTVEKSHDLLKLIRPDLLHFVPFSSARDEAKNGKIWLNANESPFNYVLTTSAVINRYPEKQPKEIIEAIAKLYKVNADELVLSRGSDEAIDLLTRLFCIPKNAVMACPPTFVMYKSAAHLNGATYIEVPLTKDFQLDLPQLFAHWNPTIKLVFLCSPNNPTGNLIRKADIIACCEYFIGKAIVVVDEAYIEYTQVESFTAYIHSFPNLVVLRTLSKAYGLAGLRAGFLISNAELIKWILKVIAPYPTPILTSAAIAEILNPERMKILKEHIEITIIERERVFNALQKLPIIEKVWPSETNFILFKTRDADKLMAQLSDIGIILRNMNNKAFLANCLRMTIGTPTENDAVILALEKLSAI